MKKVDTTESVDLGEFLGDRPVGFEDVGIEDFLPPSEVSAEAPDFLGSAAREAEDGVLKIRIAEYYLNKQLEESLLEYGSIPETSCETSIGIGFIDIVDYSYISSWLSPRENQVFLNGLYTAFHLVLKRSGGFLNKISGDSMMFHFGGTIDCTVRSLGAEEAPSFIARSLFRTCVEVQESCRLFNRADEDFIPAEADEASKKAMSQAFAIIRTLRENLSMVSSIDAMFQVRIRIGASMGQVCIGNFGPEGARQWDVIGNPVIEARRMESTAPVDGIRLGRPLYERLRDDGMPEEYLKEFRGRASGFYQGIQMDELFKTASVVLKDKKGIVFDSCAVQANPDLPEDVWRLVESALFRAEGGAESIVELIRYYRGNRLVVQAIEELFRERGISLRKSEIYEKVLPKRYASLLKARGGDEAALKKAIDARVSLFQLFRVLGRYQDRLKDEAREKRERDAFKKRPEGSGAFADRAEKRFHEGRSRREREAYFEEVLLPFVFFSIESTVLEYAKRRADTVKTA